MKNGIHVQGIKCDTPDCNFEDPTVELENYKNWLNKPCPHCGANLLTQEDMNAVKAMIVLIDALNEAGIVPETAEDMHTYKVEMDGSGKLDLKEIKK